RERRGVSLVVVDPVVVDADEALGPAARLHADERTAVRAAVFPGVQRPFGVARDHHRHVADEGGDETLRPGKLGLEAQVAPRRPAPDALLLLPVERFVLVDPVWNARHALGRPASVQHQIIIITASRPIDEETNLIRVFLCSLALLASTTVSAQTGSGEAYSPVSGQPGKDVVWVPTPYALIEKMLDMAKVTPQDYV